MEGARLALGGAYETRFDLSKARVIACLEADPLFTWPGSLRHMRDWAEKREPSAEMNRLYAIECSMSVTGMSADHRLRVKPSQVERVALGLAARLGSRGGPLSRLAVPGARVGLDAGQQRFVDALAADLQRAGSAAVLMAGPRATPLAHALAHAINAALGSAAVSYQKPQLLDPDAGTAGLRALTEEIRAGKVDTLVVTAANPVYSAPYDLNFGTALASVRNSVYRGLYYDETSDRAGWFLPATHPLEAWGDARAHDGTVSFVQPLIQPLFNGVTEAQVLAAFLGEGDKSPYAQLRDYWR